MTTKAKEKPKKARKPRPPKAKQGYLDPEMEPPTHKDIDQAADNYFETMQERKELTETEDTQKDALIDLMKKYGLTRYEMPDGKVVMVTDTANVKVRKAKKPTEGGVENEFVDGDE